MHRKFSPSSDSEAHMEQNPIKPHISRRKKKRRRERTRHSQSEFILPVKHTENKRHSKVENTTRETQEFDTFRHHLFSPLEDIGDQRGDTPAPFNRRHGIQEELPALKKSVGWLKLPGNMAYGRADWQRDPLYRGSTIHEQRGKKYCGLITGQYRNFDPLNYLPSRGGCGFPPEIAMELRKKERECHKRRNRSAMEAKMGHYELETISHKKTEGGESFEVKWSNVESGRRRNESYQGRKRIKLPSIHRRDLSPEKDY